MPKKPNLKTKLKAYKDWLEGLSEGDRMNFEALIELPNAAVILAGCPDAQYRDMAVFALALKIVANKLQPKEPEDAPTDVQEE